MKICPAKSYKKDFLVLSFKFFVGIFLSENDFYLNGISLLKIAFIPMIIKIQCNVWVEKCACECEGMFDKRLHFAHWIYYCAIVSFL